MVDMANHLDYLDEFVKRMKEKIIARSIKHPHEDALTLTEVIGHLACELGEMFNLSQEDEKEIARILFASKKIDGTEGIDVANMSWIIAWMLENEGKPSD